MYIKLKYEFNLKIILFTNKQGDLCRVVYVEWDKAIDRKPESSKLRVSEREYRKFCPVYIQVSTSNGCSLDINFSQDKVLHYHWCC